MTMFSKPVLYYNSLKSLTFKQTFGRIFAEIKLNLKLYQLPRVPDEIKGNLPYRVPFNENDPWNSKEEILKGNFIFSHEHNSLNTPISWNPENMTQACRLHIHFFNFLYLLDDENKKEICKSWINSNKDFNKISWQPYGLSLRIFSWMRANLNDPDIDKSIYEQASFLYRNNEFYIPANHYLENGRALLFAGIYFNREHEAKKWFNKGLHIILNALDEQIEEDGAHYEKSLMYHNIALQLFVDVLNVLTESNENYNLIYSKIEKMADFQKSILHPDNNIALFSDSVLEMGNSPTKILNYVYDVTGYKAKFKNKFEYSGHYIFKNEKLYFILDAGKMASPKMSSHAHSDIFNYELSINSKRVIVDSGVGTYDASPQRDFIRSTRAHNTLCIDKKNQAELWKSFRVGKMYDPKDVSFNFDTDTFNFTGVFDGYAKIIGDRLEHQRKIEFSKDNLFVADSITGKNFHLFESMIHLHPDVKINNKSDRLLELRLNDNIVIFEALEGELNIEESFYYPEMGLGIPNKTLVVFKKCSAPISLIYSLNF